MNVSALEIELKALEASLSILETKLTILSVLLLVSTGVVVVGLFVEYRPDFKEFLYGRPRDRREPWPVVIGGILVILGVAGELACSSLALIVESKIRVTSSKIENDLRSEISLVGISAIGAVNTAAAANTLSQEASTTAGTAKKEADQVREVASAARDSAGEAGKLADESRAKTVALGNELSVAENAELEARQKMVEMEQWIAPRILPIIVRGGKANFAALTPFSDFMASIESVDDQEARTAAGQIRTILNEAGWKKLISSSIPDFPVNDGVTILSYQTPTGSPDAFFGDECRSLNAAMAIEDFLNDNGWQEVNRGLGSHGDSPIRVPVNSVRILVGLKPNPYFTAAWSKESQDAIRRIKEIKDRRREERARLGSSEKMERCRPPFTPFEK